MNSLIKAIHKKWIEKIKSGEKTIELGKGFQNVEVPFKNYIYEPKKHGGCGMVVGEFICDEIVKIELSKLKESFCIFYYSTGENSLKELCEKTGLTLMKIWGYSNGKSIYALHITAPKFYDKPKELSEFKRVCKNNGFSKCRKCKHYLHKSWNENIDNCYYGGLISIERAPQNFIYCEDLEETK